MGFLGFQREIYGSIWACRVFEGISMVLWFHRVIQDFEMLSMGLWDEPVSIKASSFFLASKPARSAVFEANALREDPLGTRRQCSYFAVIVVVNSSSRSSSRSSSSSSSSSSSCCCCCRDFRWFFGLGQGYGILWARYCLENCRI